MEEKKLTDEEVIKAFENCNNGGCKDCSYRNAKNKDRCNHKKLNGEIINLIRCLQSENEYLKSLTEDGKILENLAIYKTKTIDNEKEIHRLQDENATLKSELKKELEEHEEFTKKANAEIERLKSEIKGYEGIAKRAGELLKENTAFKTGDLQARNAKLQKQVDELTEFKKEVFSLGLYKLGLSDGVNSFAERLKEEVNGDINRIYALGCGAVAPLCRFIEQIDEIAKEITEGKK